MFFQGFPGSDEFNGYPGEKVLTGKVLWFCLMSIYKANKKKQKVYLQL